MDHYAGIYLLIPNRHDNRCCVIRKKERDVVHILECLINVMVEKLRGIAGSMYAGKTEELIREVIRAEIAGRMVKVVKPSLDIRWGETDSVRSHSGAKHDATPVNIRNPRQILRLRDGDTSLIAVDEVQFFNHGIIPVIDELLERDVEVVFSGLPLDFRGEPFGPMPELLAKADSITRLTAICTHSDNGNICGEQATRTQRFVNGKPASYYDPIVLIGAEESYAARCPTHHIVPDKPKYNTKRR